MTMTRQHFVLIAEVLREAEIDGLVPNNSIELLAERFASKLRATNHSFNRDRFLRACGVEA